MSNTVICLCGSTRFLSDFETANKELTKLGLAIISISMVMPKQEAAGEEALKHLLDLVHLNKILRSDAVFIVGNGYFGLSTAREILWAEMLNKPVISQWTTHSWQNAAHCLRYGSFTTDIFPKARERLGLPL